MARPRLLQLPLQLWHGLQVAIGETFILLHLSLPSVGGSIGIERGRQQNDNLADGYLQAFRELCGP